LNPETGKPLNCSKCVLEQIAPLAKQVNCLEIERIAQVCVDKFSTLVGMKYASLYLLEESNEILRLQKNNHPFPVDKIVSLNKKPTPPMVLAIKSRKMIIVGDIERHKNPNITKAQRQFSGNYQTNNCIIVPMICKNKVVGVLNLADKIENGKFTCNAVALLELFSQLVGESIGNIRLFEKMQRQATTDGLTDLANHRTFYETLEKELWRCRRYNERISIIMIDIDNLKTINDKYGHRIGDKVIRKISRIIQASVRQMDTAARYGGDEFAVILPNTSLAESKTAAQRIVSGVNNVKMEIKGSNIKLSVSVGLGEYGPESSPMDMTHYSDLALYSAKKAGKNTVRIFEKAKN
jgi:diguanylate cyclase (GGDEF)-like protein